MELKNGQNVGEAPGAQVFTHLSDHARDAVVRGQLHARREGRDWMDNGDLLNGLSQVRHGSAAHVLRALAVSTRDVAHALVPVVQDRQGPRLPNVRFDPSVLEGLTAAGHLTAGQHTVVIRTHHVLLAMLDRRDDRGAAALTRLGVSAERVEARLRLL